MNNKKKWVFILCIAVAIIIAIPVCSKMYFERIRYIEPIATNIYEFDFISHWKQVADVLHLDEQSMETARIEDLNVNYEISGKIKDIGYSITWKEEEQLYHAHVSFYEGNKNIDVKATRVSEWLQYSSMFSANSLFSNLDEVNIKDLTSKDDYSYYGLSIGVWDNPTIPDGELFSIEENSIVSLKSDIPVNGCWIRTYCMEQFEANAYSSAQNQYYLLNLQ